MKACHSRWLPTTMLIMQPERMAARASADQAEVGPVDEGGGLKGLAPALACEVRAREFAELGVDEGEEHVGSAGVAALNRIEDTCNVGHADGAYRRARGFGTMRAAQPGEDVGMIVMAMGARRWCVW